MRNKNHPLEDIIGQIKSADSGSSNSLPLIEHDYRIEIIRKAIHLCSLSIPIAYYYLPKSIILYILIPLTIAFLTVDIARHYHKPIEDWFYKYFGFMLRKHESDKRRKTLNGATYVLISATICVIIFPKIITVASFAILIISDITAALIGRRFGKHRFFSKSLEGSAGFFFSALIVIAVSPKIEYQLSEYLISIVAAFVGTITEALPVKIDDNLSIPIVVGITLWLLYIIFLPTLNIYKFG
ncbi:MAG: SEC59/DGK1/VTE5 family protein [Bacteroidota bacterium]|nr:SEC59/DGK1/VTE5 family protein [Bacteroidota bacterium]